MIVCHCRAVSDRVVDAELRAGVSTVNELTARCGAGGDCGGCHRRLEQLLRMASPAPMFTGTAA